MGDLAAVYSRGIGVDVYSATLARWTEGTVVDIDENGDLIVHYVGPSMELLEKRIPPGHAHCRLAAHPWPLEFLHGAQVEIFSSTLQSWTVGTVIEVLGEGCIVVGYTTPDGLCLQKTLPITHECIRAVYLPDLDCRSDASACTVNDDFAENASTCASDTESQAAAFPGMYDSESQPQSSKLRQTVRFSDEDPVVCHVEPYCDHYGVHPSLFVFDAAGNKLVVPPGSC
eukprot:TRINITY_DN27600_c0_g1_i1.p1 TRINITY_DN27600_c0_g1~~TRINITY_DN27600_c0_g1_i1.p1  ORF type:complete len:228 (-),score=18.86 TRINITY_DN27600_c0_g1_i1:112-795(-)